MNRSTIVFVLVVAALSTALVFGCSDSGGMTGGTCEATEDCYPGVEIEGEPICFTQVEGGYCSHTCTSNSDCCAADGECPDGFDYICTGLESRDDDFCFIECTESDGPGGDQSICDEISGDLECRNTGRGTGSQACLPPAEQ